jgi:hypothetical protein
MYTLFSLKEGREEEEGKRKGKYTCSPDLESQIA